jgi:hypothetical protein
MKLKLRHIAAQASLICAVSAFSIQTDAATCPFDTPGTALTREGLVLSRYANGFTGNALVANSGFAATDAPAIQSNIVALTDQLDLNRNGSFDTTDATIISRKIAGFSNAAATAGIPAANLGPGGASAVNSFLLSGCGNNAWVQGGNAFGAPGVIGTTDNQILTVQSAGAHISLKVAGGDGLRITKMSGTYSEAVNVNNGSSNNVAGPLIFGTTIQGATVSGGGREGSNCFDHVLGTNTRECGNRATEYFATVSGGTENAASNFASTVAGGQSNTASDYVSTVGGGLQNVAAGARSTVAGGGNNYASFYASTVGGGSGNTANGDFATVAGGNTNNASGTNSTVVGGRENRAAGNAALAAGTRAKAINNNAFVWGGSPSNDTNDAGPETFTAYAPGGFYFFRGAPGAGGCTLPAGTVSWSCTSDRNTKTNITSLNARDILKRVANISITRWSYKGTESIANIGPMAQDFWRAFKLGDSDKSIASMNMSGVALAAIQGLNQKLTEQVKAKDREIAALKARLDAIEKKLLSTR